MSIPEPAVPSTTYRVLLIGIDAYPEGYRSLYGCVNDIDAIENVLLELQGAAGPEDQERINIEITRFAALHENAISSSRFVAETLRPTKKNIVQALQRLRAAHPNDRVLIYYSGHGYYLRWQGSSVAHEALVTCDAQFLYDVEVNKLLNDIAVAVNGDLTVVLDCCHSSGVFRAIINADPDVGDRFFQRSVDLWDDGLAIGPPPDWSILGDDVIAQVMAEDVTPLLRVASPNYLVVAACQAFETARERPIGGEYRGLLSAALIQLIKAIPASDRLALRWADIWSRLLDQVEQLKSPMHRQHPWLVGRPERRIFGGNWRPQDPGLPVSPIDSRSYRIAAGSLMGLTAGTEVALYGPEPDEFPVLDTEEDRKHRLALLRVNKADRASCIGEVTEVYSNIPNDGLRGRIARPADDEPLRVGLDPFDDETESFLSHSPLLRVVTGTRMSAEARVWGNKASGWRIGDDITADLANVPPGEFTALRAGLEHYSRYNSTLRLADKISRLKYANPIEMDLLDCNDPSALARITDPHHPDLPALPSTNRRGYILPTNTLFCLRVRNRYNRPLYVTVLNCEAFGYTDRMDELMIWPRDEQVSWQRLTPLPPTPWRATPSKQRDEVREAATDRLIVVATTREGVRLDYLQTSGTVQQVVDASIGFREAINKMIRYPEGEPAVPDELWVAELIMVKIGNESALGSS